MRITRIHARQPATPGSPPDWRTQLGQILVEITTSDGVVGVGVGGGGAAGVHIIETVLQDLLVGSDATDIESLHRSMCDHTAFYGRSGIVVMAISGVDLALWDIRGKVAQQPVATLLNPDVDLTKGIPTYCTVFDDRETEQALEAGHRAVKLHVERFGDTPNVRDIEALVRRVRDAMGPNAPLMIDAFARWDVATTLAVAHAVAQYNVAWVEEPLLPDDFGGYAALVEQSPVLIAGGEHEYLRGGFSRLLDEGLHAIVQPDINWCGGLTTLVEVYQMAAAANVRVVPHRGAEPFAIHAIAALDSNPLAESPRTWFNCLRGAPTIEGGLVHVANRPGFGVSTQATRPS